MLSGAHVLGPLFLKRVPWTMTPASKFARAGQAKYKTLLLGSTGDACLLVPFFPLHLGKILAHAEMGCQAYEHQVFPVPFYEPFFNLILRIYINRIVIWIGGG
jgi:hypothetical protein